jgi:hypothetical protein
MTESVLIILPLPSRYLSPNCPPGSRGGRLRKAAIAKRYRALAKAAVLEAGIETGPWESATVQVAFYHRTKRRRDDVNALAMMKPAYDGAVDAGLLADDDSEHLTTLPASFAIDRDAPRVELMFQRA